MSGNAVPPARAALDASTYLDRIVPSVRARLEERRQAVPLRELEARLGTRSVSSVPSFAAALRLPGISLIAEVKRRSPSKGPIKPGLDVTDLVGAYERGGARAISVLTEEDHFAGGLADLDRAVAATTLPILRKDFVLDEYQVVEAAVHGASAVLLIAVLLPVKRMEALALMAAELALDVLVEIHDEGELERAVELDDALIGINNRDLRTFEVSLAVTERLADKVPEGRLVLSESGISTRKDVETLRLLGVDGVLVGESLLRSADVESAIAELLSLPTGVALPSEKKRRDATTERKAR